MFCGLSISWPWLAGRLGRKKKKKQLKKKKERARCTSLLMRSWGGRQRGGRRKRFGGRREEGGALCARNCLQLGCRQQPKKPLGRIEGAAACLVALSTYFRTSPRGKGSEGKGKRQTFRQRLATIGQGIHEKKEKRGRPKGLSFPPCQSPLQRRKERRRPEEKKREEISGDTIFRWLGANYRIVPRDAQSEEKRRDRKKKKGERKKESLLAAPFKRKLFCRGVSGGGEGSSQRGKGEASNRRRAGAREGKRKGRVGKKNARPSPACR